MRIPSYAYTAEYATIRWKHFKSFLKNDTLEVEEKLCITQIIMNNSHENLLKIKNFQFDPKKCSDLWD